MTLQQLRSFIALADTLNFSRAAEQLNMTQPPLSRQISALEQSVGTPLFRRHSRSVVLTPAGLQFQRDIARLLTDLERAGASARAAALGEQGELRIAFTMYAAWHLLPELISAYAEHHPQVQLRLEETLPRDLQQALLSGAVDAGVSFPLHLPDGLHYQALFQEPLCAVLPAAHRLAGAQRIAAGELAGDAFICFPASTAPPLHEAVMRCCHGAGFTPQIRVETHLQQTIVNLVARGLGVALVPASMARMQLAGCVFVPLTDAPLVEQGLYWNPDNPNPCLASFAAASTALSLPAP
tara:strand:- start:1432 stop:2319 length:888 start_codon:yes stop_codon:yes gene_type:complete